MPGYESRGERGMARDPGRALRPAGPPSDEAPAQRAHTPRHAFRGRHQTSPAKPVEFARNAAAFRWRGRLHDYHAMNASVSRIARSAARQPRHRGTAWIGPTWPRPPSAAGTCRGPGRSPTRVSRAARGSVRFVVGHPTGGNVHLRMALPGADFPCTFLRDSIRRA